jgi:hypothetical protein
MGTSRAAGLCHDVIADRMIPPRARATPSPSLPTPLLLGDSGVGIRLARKPLRLHPLYVVGQGLGFLLLWKVFQIC